MKSHFLIIGASHTSTCSLVDAAKEIVEKQQQRINEIGETFEFKNYRIPEPYLSAPLNRSQRRKQEKLNRKKKP